MDNENRLSLFSKLISKATPIVRAKPGLPGLETWKKLSNSDFLQLFSLQHTHEEEFLESGQTYDKAYDFIYTGCSETTGTHLSEIEEDWSQRVFVWGDIVSKSLDTKDSLNLSKGGASAFSIINSAITQIMNQGKPNHLLVLLPRIDSRLAIPKEPKYLRNREKKNSDYNFIAFFTNIGDFGVTKYSSSPHIVEDIFPRSFVTYLNIQSILALEALCSLSNINLIYSTWSTETHEILTAANLAAKENKVRPPFPNYIDSDYKYGAAPISDGCHDHLKQHKRYEQGRANHMGVHAHAHFADSFIKELTKRGYAASL